MVKKADTPSDCEQERKNDVSVGAPVVPDAGLHPSDAEMNVAPAEQLEQEEAPEKLYKLAPQGEQEDAPPVAKVPARQSLQDEPINEAVF
jgi:hypothetical protein